ncbi:MAG: hypothetical protein PVH00_00315 [Gemmatimonadota bacterium]
MRALLLMCMVVPLAACATTYGMPLSERSRSYRSTESLVWDAVLEAVDDVDLAAVQSDIEHGLVRARASGSIWDLKGHEVTVVVRDLGDGRIRVDANASTVSEDQKVDFGRSKGLVRDFLSALDRRMEAH